MEHVRKLDKLATDLSWDTHGYFLEMLEPPKSIDDEELTMLYSSVLKERLRSRFLSLIETPIGPVKTVDEVLPQLIAEVRAIQEEFGGSNEVFLPVFIMLVQRLRSQMLEIVRMHELNRNGGIDPNLHQRAADHFRTMFYYQLLTFIITY